MGTRHRDIGSRAAAEVLEAERRLSSLFHNVPVGLFRTTPEGEFLLANQTLVEMLGYSDLSQFQQANAKDFYVEPRRRREIMAQAEALETAYDMDAQMRRRGGTLIWVRETTRAVRGEDGRVLFYEGSIRDITDLKEAEQARIEAETLFRTAFERSVVPMAIATAEGIITRANDALVSLLGYSQDELLSAGWHLLVHPADLDSALERVERFSQPSISTIDEVTRHMTKTGETVRTRLILSKLLDVAGAPAALVQLTEAPPRQIRVDDILVEALRRLPPDSRSKVSWDRSETVVLADTEPLERLLDLVLSGATGAGAGSITIEQDREGRFLLLSIVDDGEGLPGAVVEEARRLASAAG
ncbi:MAG TPA: PAS domain S-box protein, partial [Acidimicrobiia bacterium]